MAKRSRKAARIDLAEVSRRLDEINDSENEDTREELK